MSPAAPPVFRRVWPAWLALLLAALAGATWWWAIGRPVALPDAPSARIACVSYAPFRLAGETPLDARAYISPERIDADLRALSQRFDCVRTYSQGQGLSAVPEIAGRYGMQVLLGIWLGGDAKSNAQQVALGIATANRYPQVVRGLIVGNEVLLRGELSPARLAGYLQQVRAAVGVPVTYADVWEFWLRHPELAGSVDYLTIHILPYWEDQPVPPEGAVQHVAAVYAKVQQAFPGRRVMIGETGWPSAGRPRQAASASVVNEARYLREFLRYAATVHMPYNVIEAFDQPWKRAQEGTAGGYWGIFDAQARPKFAMQGPVTEEPRWWLGWLAAAAGGVLFALAGGRRPPHRPAARPAAGRHGQQQHAAWQYRRALYACRDGWEWALSLAACALALLTALRLARWMVAARLDGDPAPGVPPRLAARRLAVRAGVLRPAARGRRALPGFSAGPVLAAVRRLCAARLAGRAPCGRAAAAGGTLPRPVAVAAGPRGAGAGSRPHPGGVAMAGPEPAAGAAGAGGVVAREALGGAIGAARRAVVFGDSQVGGCGRGCCLITSIPVDHPH
ncbi:glycoside hydrolase family 17 protein [Rhodanobacter sp. FW106-PBR-LB-2-11]|uniref:glycoside hydrolase family 17 protein n=1 Tax=Rhodanobacter sp. FW106-PBR-LB-2-11 TaxID=1524463 RepID=UPI0034E5DABC